MIIELKCDACGKFERQVDTEAAEWKTLQHLDKCPFCNTVLEKEDSSSDAKVGESVFLVVTENFLELDYYFNTNHVKATVPLSELSNVTLKDILEKAREALESEN